MIMMNLEEDSVATDLFHIYFLFMVNFTAITQCVTVTLLNTETAKNNNIFHQNF